MMQRFASYIYLYNEKEQRVQNVGYGKVAREGENCRLTLAVQNTGLPSQNCPVYFFTRRRELLLGIEIGKMQIVNGAGTFDETVNPKEKSQGKIPMQEVEGFLILPQKEKMLASQWTDGQIRRAWFEAYVPEKTEEPNEEKGTLHAMEVAVASQTEPQAKQEKKQEKRESWSQLFDQYEWEALFPKEPNCSGIKIQLQDLRLLPQMYWYLGNNHFLMHGFSNYHHLILGRREADDKVSFFLGVPGVFENQEHVVAAMFGFPDFRLSEASEIKTGKNGYWCRPIRLEARTDNDPPTDR
ncbi:MAG: DUF6128 domain-containing protein [Lachnospiraceae bacterium]